MCFGPFPFSNWCLFKQIRFGRGYSDCPADLPQDNRLFTTQILLALASSPISWTGAESGKFCLTGYSLGGGIAAAFAAYFPQLISSLVLLAPAGLVRDSQVSFQSRLLYERGFVPENVLGYLVGRRLRAGPLVSPSPRIISSMPQMRSPRSYLHRTLLRFSTCLGNTPTLTSLLRWHGR